MEPNRPSPGLWSLPKTQRPPHGLLWRGLLWACVFNLGILTSNLLQLLVYPLSLLPSTQTYYVSIIRFTKGAPSFPCPIDTEFCLH